LLTNLSYILAAVLVIANGLISFLTNTRGKVLARGLIRDSFYWKGTTPRQMHEIVIDATGSAIMSANSLRMLFGIPSGPTA
jgi:hypothetical protein